MDTAMIKRHLLEQEEIVIKAVMQELVPREKQGIGETALKTSLVKAIIGPRRSGKTTFGLQLLQHKDHYYVNFDDEALSMVKKEELGMLLESLHELFGKRKYIFLDEIQNIMGWELFVNRLQRMGFNVVISGSNSHLLSSELSSHLGGRTFTIEILPFSFQEYIHTAKQGEVSPTDEGIGLIKNRLRTYMRTGGFPEIVLRLPKDLHQGYFEELFNTVILRDIARRYNVRHVSEIISIANIVINSFSARQSVSNISRSVGCSSHTVKKYLTYLEEAYLVFSCRKFSFKPKEVESSFRKYYLIDPGILTSKKVTRSPDFGRMMENIVALELRARGKDLYYYMADDKYESDFVLFEKNKTVAVLQVSNDETALPAREQESGLLACRRLSCKRLIIITWNAKGKEIREGVTVQKIPLWEWLLEKPA
jgi:predicted AAA+ superfamily ATPase